MSHEIIINATPEETRVALLENKVLTEIYFDRKRDRGILGNVYKGVVEKVLPGMQAAFVNIGTEKAAFLYVADIVTEKERNAAETGEVEEVEFEERSPDEKPVEGEEEAEGGASPDVSSEAEPALARPKRRSHPRVEELLQEGQEIMIQVSKGPIGTKGPRATGFISLPGRFLVYMPFVNSLGISRRIGSEGERRRLKDLICKLRKRGTGGYIVRTVSEGITETEIQNDIAFLESTWESILKKQSKGRVPALLHTDLDLVFRTVRDLFTKEIDRLVIDSKVEYEGIQEFVGTYFPEFLPRVELWEKQEPIFEALGLEAEIAKARNRRVWLKSGGYLVIDRAEALTVIDVNTGRFVGKQGLEETILKTNMEAAKETARQLRLRNIGGIIIIDLIDMEKEKNRDKVFNALASAVANDKARTRLIKISDLGLLEMSRERTHEALSRVLSEPCPYCEGKGYTKSPATISYEIFREIRSLNPSSRDKEIMVAAHPAVVGHIYDSERSTIEAITKMRRKKMKLKADANFHIERYEICLL